MCRDQPAVFNMKAEIDSLSHRTATLVLGGLPDAIYLTDLASPTCRRVLIVI